MRKGDEGTEEGVDLDGILSLVAWLGHGEEYTATSETTFLTDSAAIAGGGDDALRVDLLGACECTAASGEAKSDDEPSVTSKAFRVKRR